MLKLSPWQLMILAVLPAVMLTLSGCEDFTLGGQIMGANAPLDGNAQTNAHFGGNFHCDDSSGSAFISGQFQYRDPTYTKLDSQGKERSLQIHVSLPLQPAPAPAGFSCQELDEYFTLAFGGDGYQAEYCPQPKQLGDCGIATILIEDNGKQGPDKEDSLHIELNGGFWGFILGVQDGYMNGGTLLRGQITQHI